MMNALVTGFITAIMGVIAGITLMVAIGEHNERYKEIEKNKKESEQKRKNENAKKNLRSGNSVDNFNNSINQLQNLNRNGN